VQTPTHVAITVEMIHDARIIPIGEKRDAKGFDTWLGNSVGWWEGDTLVVQTRNFHHDIRVRPNMCDGYYAKGRKDRLSQGSGKLQNRILQNGESQWDASPPTPEYFEELRRVSRHQIIWGGNYFADKLPASRCWIYWQKDMGGDFADGELAWTSFDRVLKQFRKRSETHGRIHPTQKPVDLYKWTLANFAKTGMRVLDTHLGSGSLAIAAHYAGIHLTACEIDADYFHAAKARIARETSQADFFSPQNNRRNL
jgi:site-specific DNA-methyltransferase (adenine-specific)